MLAPFSLLLGSTLLAFMFFILIFASLGFMVGLPITALTLGLSVLCTFSYGLLVTKFYFKEDLWRMFVKLCVTVVLLLVSFMYISGLFYDISYDGQDYHQEAVGQLANNWNPFHEYLTKEKTHGAVLLNHYAKGPWLYAASLYKVTGQIEQSKVFNFLLMIASFLLALSTMKSCGRFNVRQSVLFSVLMALNPVSIYQAFSFYIDGQMGSLLLCLLALSYRLVTGYDKVVLGSFIMSIALIANIKFTGIVYAVACIGLVGGWLWLMKRKHLYRNFAKSSLIGLFIGICVIGYNPYITNMVYYGHPFYPLYGKGPEIMDIMTSNSPPGFTQMNSLEKLYVATFSMSNNQFETEKPKLKVPFTVKVQELRPFVYGADIRIGGFGPWFSGMLVLTGIIVVLLLVTGTKEWLYGGGVVVSILLSALINPECWWARYVPQLWLVPICIAAVASSETHKRIRYLGAVLTVAVMMNIALISYPYILGTYYCTKALNQELQQIAEEHIPPVKVYFNKFTSTSAWFARKSIGYIAVPAKLADVSIDELRYKYMVAICQKPLLAKIFVDERKSNDE